LPRGERVNTRTKDLIDMVLLIREEKLDRTKTAGAVRATFAKRVSHDVPKELDPPPPEWEPVFDALAKECNLDMKLYTRGARIYADLADLAARKRGKMSEAVFQHVRVMEKKFEGSSVVLDNTWFENCSFENFDVLRAACGADSYGVGF
jgi:hypothetical protein